jgi:hypothetical protein
MIETWPRSRSSMSALGEKQALAMSPKGGNDWLVPFNPFRAVFATVRGLCGVVAGTKRLSAH